MLKELLKIHFKKSYARSGEDIIFGRTFSGKGFYIDIGSHHPIRGSSTYFLYKRGWSGITIEPHPKYNLLYKITRPRDTHLSIGISDVAGASDYYMFVKNKLNTFDEEKAKKLIEENRTPFIKKVKLPVRTLSMVLSEHNVPQPDLLCIDAEEYDMRVLNSNLWNKWRPKLVMVEDNSFEFFNKNEICIFMEKNGYQLFSVVINNLIFKKIIKN